MMILHDALFHGPRGGRSVLSIGGPSVSRLVAAAALALALPSQAANLALGWTNNMLTIAGPTIPGGAIQVWYIEAFCRTGSTHRQWDKTTIPHRTELVAATPDGSRIQLRSVFEPSVRIDHQIEAGPDEVRFQLELHNAGSEAVDVDWFQPCIRVGEFTGLDQSTYPSRCFIFTKEGQRMLDQTRRTEEAIYRGGQVYVPEGIDTNDVNPRPISPEVPINGLIGAISADGRQLMATAWDQTQELFQGVIVCIHNDPRVGGLGGGETKRLRGRLYVMENNPAALLARYHRDFGSAARADWPRWRGPAGDGHVPEHAWVPARIPEAPRVLWRKPVGLGLASPVVAGGRLFYVDNQDGKEVLHAADPQTGEELWQAEVDEAFKDAQSPPGPRATPTVDESRVYAQSCRGELRCFDTTDGRLIWGIDYTQRFQAPFIGEKGQAVGASRHGYNGAPIVIGHQLIALAGSPQGAGVVALDKTDGRVLWTSTDELAAYAPPVFATVAGRSQVLCFMADALLGVEPADGTRLWRVPLKTTFARHVMTPIAVGDLVLVASHELGLVATRLVRGEAQLVPEQAWITKEAAFNFSSPVAVGGHVYGLGPDKNLICVDTATGRLRWSEEGITRSAATKAYASFIALGKNILALTDGGELLLFAANPDKFDLISRVQVCGQNWCHPAYASGRLYLRDERQIYCLSLDVEP